MTNDLDADFDEYIGLLEENARLKGLVAAYENDLVLVDVAEKLTAANDILARAIDYIRHHISEVSDFRSARKLVKEYEEMFNDS